MRILYEGTDITNSVDVNKADIYDNAGGMADTIELKMTDTEGYWNQWKPQKGDTIEVTDQGASSGLMFIDQLEQERGQFLLKAISTPLDAKTCRTKAWENIRFLALAEEIAGHYGFTLKTYNVTDWQYARLDQKDQNDFDFLRHRCLLEGYMLKITNRSVIIYNEQHQENEPAAETIYVYDFDGRYNFQAISSGLFRSCAVVYESTSGLITSEFTPQSAPAGGILREKETPISSQAEADRFSRNLLRSKNKYEYIGSITTKVRTHLAAGNSITISGVGFGDGKYFIEQIIHRLVEQKSKFKLHKPLQGY